MKVDWHLRFRSPIAPTKGVDDVTIQTNGPDPARAQEVAEFWLKKAMPHPSTRFIFVRPAVVQTEDDMVKEQSGPAESASKEPAAKKPAA